MENSGEPHFSRLNHLTVVEVSSLVAGPAMGSLLRQLGARVIKVEQPVVGDPSRKVSPWGFINYNFGKESVSLDLKNHQAQKVLHDLVSRADIFLENMGPDVPNRLGFSYETLKELNPRLIYCSIKGFSKGSRYRAKPAFDAVAQAMSGIMSLTGEPNGEPLRIGNPAVDLGAAAYGTIEVLAALIQRERSHKGAFIEIPLLDMSVYWNGYWISFYGMTGTMPQRLGSGHLGYSPHKVFVTRDGAPIFIATLSDEQWKKLSELLGISLGEEFLRMEYRLSHRQVVEKAVAEAVSKLDAEQVVGLLGDKVPWAPVNSIAQVYDDEELLTRGVIQNANYEEKSVRFSLPPIGNSHGASENAVKLPSVGQDTEHVLSWLGYSPKQIESLREKRAI